METKQVSPMCKTQRVRWPQTSLTSPFVFERVVLICTRTRKELLRHEHANAVQRGLLTISSFEHQSRRNHWLLKAESVKYS